MNKTSTKLFLLVLKYAPALMLFCMVVYCVLGLFGINTLTMVEALARYSLPTAVLFWLASDSFGFCRLHKAFILYDYAACVCIDYNKTVGFSVIALDVAHIAFAAVGVMLLIQLGKLKCKECNEDESEDAGTGCNGACGCS